jgi:predicted RNA-binding Zn-ribbon protein involved in translation (DUF1610 family)
MGVQIPLPPLLGIASKIDFLRNQWGFCPRVLSEPHPPLSQENLKDGKMMLALGDGCMIDGIRTEGRFIDGEGMCAEHLDRRCVSCGRSIPRDSNICPYCGQDYRQILAGSRPRRSLTLWWKAHHYFWSAFFPPFGFVIGRAYRLMPDPEYKHVGDNCVKAGWIGVVVWVGWVAIGLILRYGL